jgi:prepilin-type N-terminal cleavage/methylation domain-containing protein
MRRGFTLIELLVVIAIVLLLAGMLFPVFMGARRAGQKAVCQNNLRQLSMAFLMYVQDYDDHFPDTGDAMLWMGRSWRPVLDRYVQCRPAYWCPTDSGARVKYDSTSYAYLQSFYHKAADIDAGLAAMPTPTARAYHTCALPTEPQALADVRDPARKILLIEWSTNHEQPLRTLWAADGLHMAAFVDGHVAAVRLQTLNTSVLGDKDPNWTVGGIGGNDIE